MNSVVLSGRLTREPELRKTGSGNSMTTFCIAVRAYKAEDGTEKAHFIDCVAYEKLAELIYKNVIKGEKITVMGRLTQRFYDGSDGRKHEVIEVFVTDAEFQLKLTDVAVEEPKPKTTKGKKAKKDDLPF